MGYALSVSQTTVREEAWTAGRFLVFPVGVCRALLNQFPYPRDYYLAPPRLRKWCGFWESHFLSLMRTPCGGASALLCSLVAVGGMLLRRYDK